MDGIIAAVPPASGTESPEQQPFNVVLFSSGRGSAALARQLVASPSVHLTIVINGYDDGASTGEVRRLLGDSLGPSDFRRTRPTWPSRFAAARRNSSICSTCECRWSISAADARSLVASLGVAQSTDAFAGHVGRLLESLPAAPRQQIIDGLRRCLAEIESSGRPFVFGDCSLGNRVRRPVSFADRDFNRTVDEHCGLVGLRAGLIENVTDGGNAYLVAIDADGHVLATEEAIVDAARPNQIRDIFLSIGH